MRDWRTGPWVEMREKGCEGISGWGCQAPGHNMTADWWRQASEFTTDWQRTKFEPEGHANLKEAET